MLVCNCQLPNPIAIVSRTSMRPVSSRFSTPGCLLLLHPHPSDSSPPLDQQFLSPTSSLMHIWLWNFAFDARYNGLHVFPRGTTEAVHSALTPLHREYQIGVQLAKRRNSGGSRFSRHIRIGIGVVGIVALVFPLIFRPLFCLAPHSPCS